MNNINAGNSLPVTPVKPEAPSGQAPVQQGDEAQQTGGSRTPAPPQASQAVQVALESLMTEGLDKLKQNIAGREALIISLPKEVQELVKNILRQAQAAQTAVPDGLAALLKSPKAAAEKLLLLAAALEEAAGLPGDKQAKEAGAQAEKPQASPQKSGAWRNFTPEDLKAAAKLLRELAAPPPQPGPDKPAAGRQQSPAAVFSQDGLVKAGQAKAPPPAQPNQLPEQQVDKQAANVKGPAAEPAVLAQPRSQGQSQVQPPQHSPTQSSFPQGSSESQAPQTGNEARSSLPQGGHAQSNVSQQEQASTATMNKAGQEAALPRDAANLLKAALGQPELIKSLPPEIGKLAQTLVDQAKAGLTGQKALAESLASLVKSLQATPEKVVMMASVLEQAAEPSSPEGRLAAKTPAGSQPDLTGAAAALRGKNPEELRAAAVIIRALAEAMPRADGVRAERADSQSVLTFTVPLHFGDGQAAYPAHIHVYHQEQQDKKNPGQTVTETWLRICLETENLGLVETSFRLYDGNTVDVKVRFEEQTAAAGFADHVDEVKAKLGQLPLTLGEFLVK